MKHWKRLVPKRWKLLLVIWLVSVSIRGFYALEHVTFGQDQARDLLLFERWGKEGRVLIGYGPKASVGDFYLPPLYYQLAYGLTSLFGYSPYVLPAATLMTESLTPLVLFLLLEMLTPTPIALISALVYAVSPVTVLFSTFAWNPNLIPFLTVVMVYGLARFVFKKDQQALIWSWLALTTAFHFHYQAVVLFPFMGLVFGWSLLKRPDSWRFWLLGLCLSGLTFIPYFIAEAETGFRNSRNILTYFTQDHARTFERVSKPAYALSYLPAFTERVLIGGNTRTLWLGRLVFWLGFGLLSYLAFTKRKKYLLMFSFYASVLIMLRVYKGDKLDYYLSTLFALPAVLLAILAPRLKLLLLILLLFIGFRSGRHLGALPPGNGYADLNQVMSYLETQVPEKEIRVWYQQPDYRNVFQYGFYHHQWRQNPESEWQIDVCQKLRGCGFNGQAISRVSKLHSESRMIKLDEGYLDVSGATFGEYQVVISKRTQP